MKELKINPVIHAPLQKSESYFYNLEKNTKSSLSLIKEIPESLNKKYKLS